MSTKENIYDDLTAETVEMHEKNNYRICTESHFIKLGHTPKRNNVNKYSHSCISIALDFDLKDWLLLDFSSKKDAEKSFQILNDFFNFAFPVTSIIYELDFTNTINRINSNKLNLKKHFIKYKRLHHTITTYEKQQICNLFILNSSKYHNMQR